MASGSAQPPAEEPPRAMRERAAGRDREGNVVGPPPLGEERYGPLRVLRTHKADGRSLTIYSRRPEGDAAEADGDAAADEMPRAADRMLRTTEDDAAARGAPAAAKDDAATSGAPAAAEDDAAASGTPRAAGRDAAASGTPAAAGGDAAAGGGRDGVSGERGCSGGGGRREREPRA